MGWASVVESIGITIVATILAPCWHMLVRNDKPEAQELAVGVDLIVAAMVLLSGFLPGSRGMEIAFRWAGLVVLFLLLTGMAVYTKMYGYKPGSPTLYRREVSAAGRNHYIEVANDRLTGVAGWTTTITGSTVLCAFWWLNLNIGLVTGAWEGAFH